MDKHPYSVFDATCDRYDPKCKVDPTHRQENQMKGNMNGGSPENISNFHKMRVSTKW
jgi:hypothetical protein